MKSTQSSVFDELPGARESNAGDDFHILWGTSLCLQMIRPGSTLQRVVIEGVSPIDQAGASARSFLAADITEYHGGDSFADASSVVVSQLKYSERRASRSWIPSLLAPRGQPIEKTVLGKLVDAYKGFARQAQRDVVIRKLRIRLVSNMTGSETLLRLVRESQAALQLLPEPTPSQAIMASLDPAESRAFELLSDRSGLSETDFTDFLRVLDVHYLGSSSRFDQELRIAQTMGSHVLGDVVAASHKLYDRVRRQALPEARESPGLTRSDVLALHGVTDWSDLLPLPARVVEPLFLVSQPDATHLASAIASAKSARVLAHGDAGVGKTTCLLQLEAALPPSSTVILYDCFAGGEYLGPTERRHVPMYAVRQLVNEIALSCGTPLLLNQPTDELALWRRLEMVLDSAASSLRERGGQLVLAVDAADNAVVASRQLQSDPCFVRDLWQIRLPENVHVVMTCRTARLGLLEAPESVSQLRLTGFDPDSSASHLRHHFPSASADECKAFHANSSGNPRLQAYVLDPERTDRGSTAAECASHARTTPADIFDDLIATASDTRTESNDWHLWLPTLIAMDRPIHRDRLATALAVDEGEVEAFCRGLVPGVDIAENLIAFRDEDFESHVRLRCTDEDLTLAHGRIGDALLPLRQTEGWAAETVAGHLFNSGRAEELIQLTLDDREPQAILDPLARNQAYLSRISFALRSADSTDRSDSLRLLAIAAAMQRADSAVASLIQEHSELAMRYADPIAVARIYDADSGDGWNGPLHMRVAASSARSGDLVTARAQADLAGAWVRRWSDMDQRDRVGLRLAKGDVAAFAEALFHLEGHESAIKFVRSWSPEEFSLEVALLYLQRLATTKPQPSLTELVDPAEFTAVEDARLLVAWVRNGGPADKEHVIHLCGSLVELASGDGVGTSDAWQSDFVVCASRLVDRPLLLSLITALRPNSPAREPHRGLGDWEHVLRFACVEGAVLGADVELDSLLPARLIPGQVAATSADGGEKRRLEEERGRLLRTLRENLDAYALWASSAVRSIDREVVVGKAMQVLDTHIAAHAYQYRDDEWRRRFHRTARLVIEGLVLAGADTATACNKLLTASFGGDPPLTTWLAVADDLLRKDATSTPALHLVDKVVRATHERAEPPQDAADRLIRCAGLVDGVDAVLAGDYYAAAIEALSGLDEDSSRVLGLVNHLAKSLPESDRSAGASLVDSVRLAIEHFRPYVYEPDRLPWTETLATILCLNSGVGIRTLTLWDESGDLEISDGIATVARSLLEKGEVDVVDAVQLGWLTDETVGCARAFIPILDLAARQGSARPRNMDAAGWLAKRILRHATHETRLTEARLLADWVEENGYNDAPWAEAILDLRDNFQSRTSATPPTTNLRFEAEESDEDRHSRIVLALGNTGADRPSDLSGRLEQLSADWATSEEVRAYLLEFGRFVPPTDRIAALDALAALDPGCRAWRSNTSAIVASISDWLDAWGSAQSVKTWARMNLPLFLADRFKQIVGYGYEDGSALTTFLGIPFLDDPAGIVLSSTSQHMSRLAPEQLLLIARALSDHLPESGRLKDLEWLLDDTLTGSIHSVTSLEPAVGFDLADLAWALLGHPDKRVRWRATHLVVDMGGNSDALPERLMSHWSDQGGLGFFASTSEFLWMSARVWALVGLRRLAIVTPVGVAPVAGQLEEIALDQRWPHALIRELARLILRELPPAQAPAAADSDELLLANRPTRCTIDKRHRGSGGASRAREPRITFDSMDTVPYWFEPLGRVFGIGSSEVETHAERWIVDELGFTEAAIQADRPGLRQRYDYKYFDKRHGSLPQLDDLATYLEWHALFLVAGELADGDAAMSVMEYEPPEDPWEIWLSRFLNPTRGVFVADLRDPTPNWVHARHVDKVRATWRTVEDDEIDGELLVEDSFVVSGSTGTSSGDLSESVSIDSALVTPESAESLLVCLQDSSSHYRYAFPDEDDDGEWHGHRIDDPGFQLHGWLTDRQHDGVGIEAHDPLRRIDLSVVVPGQDFRNVIPGAPTVDEWTYGHTETPGAVRILKWSDEQHWDARSSKDYTYGRQALVRTRELLSFLAAVQMELIVEVAVSRHLAAKRHGVDSDDANEEQHDCATARIYVLRRDGTLQDGLGRVRQVGQGNLVATEH